MGIQRDQEEGAKIHGLEQSVSYLSKNITKSLNPLPDYNIGKPNLPAFSFPRGDRFNLDKKSDNPPPDYYFRDSLPNINFSDFKKPNLS